MDKADKLVLDTLYGEARKWMTDTEWRDVVAEVEKAGGIVNVGGVARATLEKAVTHMSFGGSRSAAGAYAARVRWSQHRGEAIGGGRPLGNGGFDLRLDPTNSTKTPYVFSGRTVGGIGLTSIRRVESITPINASQLKRGQVISFQDVNGVRGKDRRGGYWTVHKVTRDGDKVTATLQEAQDGITHWREGPQLKLVERPWRLNEHEIYQSTHEFHVNDIVDQLRLGPAEEPLP